MHKPLPFGLKAEDCVSVVVDDLITPRSLWTSLPLWLKALAYTLLVVGSATVGIAIVALTMHYGPTNVAKVALGFVAGLGIGWWTR